MKCLRCGYCCIKYTVIIVDNPNLGVVENNLMHKTTGERCQHLEEESGQFTCIIHNKEWYKDTPCFSHTQIEQSNLNCRIGEYILQHPHRQLILNNKSMENSSYI